MRFASFAQCPQCEGGALEYSVMHDSPGSYDGYREECGSALCEHCDGGERIRWTCGPCAEVFYLDDIRPTWLEWAEPIGHEPDGWTAYCTHCAIYDHLEHYGFWVDFDDFTGQRPTPNPMMPRTERVCEPDVHSVAAPTLSL